MIQNKGGRGQWQNLKKHNLPTYLYATRVSRTAWCVEPLFLRESGFPMNVSCYLLMLLFICDLPRLHQDLHPYTLATYHGDDVQPAAYFAFLKVMIIFNGLALSLFVSCPC